MKRVLIIFLLLFFCCNNNFANELTQDYLDIAKNYYNFDNYLKAKEYIDLIMLLEPSNSAAPDFIEITTDTDYIDNSNDIVELSDSPLFDSEINDNSSSLNNQGVIYFNQEKIKNALEYFKSSISLNPKNYIAYYNLGLCYKILGKNYFAKNCFKKANKIKPDFYKPLFQAAKFEDGIKSFYLLNCAANNNDFEANFYLGKYYENNKDLNLAIKYYNKSIQIEPNLAIAYFELGRIYYDVEDYKSAVFNFKKYLTYVQTDDYAKFLLAKSYFKLGYETLAFKEIKKAIDLTKKNKYMFELSKMLYLNQDYDNAKNILEKLVLKEPYSVYYNLLGLCYFEKEDFKEALKYFEQALKLDNSSGTIYFNISRCYNILGDKNLADEYIEKAKEIIPQNPHQYSDLAIMYFKISEQEMALKTIDKAIELFSDYKLVYKVKLDLLSQMEDYEEYDKTKTDLLVKFGVK